MPPAPRNRESIRSVSQAKNGCDSPDISDYDPISVSEADAAPDGDATEEPDAPPAQTDADVFCARYNDLCPFGGKKTWFADEAECLTGYEGFTEEQIMCAEGQLDEREAGGGDNLCARAAGSGPCG